MLLSNTNLLNTIICEVEEAAQNNLRFNNLLECLYNVQIHIDYPNCVGFYQNRTVVLLTFESDDKYIIESLKSDYTKLISFCIDAIGNNYELARDDEGEPLISFKTVTQINPIPKPPEITFDKCEENLTNFINSAKHSIFGAVAWIRNKCIFDCLNKKANEGVIVVLIFDDNKMNREFLSVNKPNFKYFLVENIFGGTQYLMHEKFCIIDNQKLCHGTFNWTNRANYNDEDLSVQFDETSLEKFLDQFKHLILKYNLQL